MVLAWRWYGVGTVLVPPPDYCWYSIGFVLRMDGKGVAAAWYLFGATLVGIVTLLVCFFVWYWYSSGIVVVW